jgi:hypothetical protein
LEMREQKRKDSPWWIQSKKSKHGFKSTDTQTNCKLKPKMSKKQTTETTDTQKLCPAAHTYDLRRLSGDLRPPARHHRARGFGLPTRAHEIDRVGQAARAGQRARLGERKIAWRRGDKRRGDRDGTGPDGTGRDGTGRASDMSAADDASTTSRFDLQKCHF